MQRGQRRRMGGARMSVDLVDLEDEGLGGVTGEFPEELGLRARQLRELLTSGVCSDVGVAYSELLSEFYPRAVYTIGRMVRPSSPKKRPIAILDAEVDLVPPSVEPDAAHRQLVPAETGPEAMDKSDRSIAEVLSASSKAVAGPLDPTGEELAYRDSSLGYDCLDAGSDEETDEAVGARLALSNAARSLIEAEVAAEQLEIREAELTEALERCDVLLDGTNQKFASEEERGRTLHRSYEAHVQQLCSEYEAEMEAIRRQLQAGGHNADAMASDDFGAIVVAGTAAAESASDRDGFDAANTFEITSALGAAALHDGAPPSRRTGAPDAHTIPAPACSIRIASAPRSELVRAIFAFCDTDSDGRLNEKEMLGFARRCGFDGTDADWSEDYQFLCTENKADTSCGVDAALLERLVDDKSDAGCYCTDSELQKIRANLEKETDAPPIAAAPAQAEAAVHTSMHVQAGPSSESSSGPCSERGSAYTLRAAGEDGRETADAAEGIVAGLKRSRSDVEAAAEEPAGKAERMSKDRDRILMPPPPLPFSKLGKRKLA